MDADGDPMDALSPTTSDGVFAITPHDLTFLHLSRYSVAQWWMRAAPLGLGGALQPFLDNLLDAIVDDGVTDADVRVKGSSAAFFSSVLKLMPTTPAERGRLFDESFLGGAH